MKVTRTIEGANAALLRTLQRFEDVIHTRHIIRCHKCGDSDEYNEGDPFEAASWFEMAGWKVRSGRAKCPQCVLKTRRTFTFAPPGLP